MTHPHNLQLGESYTLVEPRSLTNMFLREVQSLDARYMGTAAQGNRVNHLFAAEGPNGFLAIFELSDIKVHGRTVTPTRPSLSHFFAGQFKPNLYYILITPENFA